MQKSSIISAVQTPTPFRLLSSRMASSSGFCQMPSRSNSPLSIFRAKSVMYSAFRKVMPKLCSFSTPAPRTAAASTTPNSSRIRFQMVACAFVEICWPTMWCTTAEKRSVSTSLSMCPACAMTSAIRSSLALQIRRFRFAVLEIHLSAFFLYNLSFARKLLI